MSTGSKLQLLLIGAVLFLASCANIAILEGGAKDTTAPKIDSARSSGNYQTGFRKQEIVLSFDEWIKFDDPSKVIVSPPTEKKPTINLKGKTIRFNFDEDEILKANATYTLNFGESIKDITEGNKTNFRFVFSTGSRIDSNKVVVSVVDAQKNEPQENILVMLYDRLGDSIVSKEKPLYFAKTDKIGRCTIENVRVGEFRVFALQDGNQNFKYDLPSEKTGFLNLPFLVRPDSQALLNIKLFEPDLPLRIKEVRQNSYGQVKVVFSKKPNGILPKTGSEGPSFLVEQQMDTLWIWYHQDSDKPWKFALLNDSIAVKTGNRSAFLSQAKLQLLPSRNAAANGVENTHPALDYELKFNYPIVRANSSNIQIQDDSSRLFIPGVNCKIDDSRPSVVKISAPWQENHRYRITVLPAAFTDLFGGSNDSIVRIIQTSEMKKFGEVSLKISGLNQDLNYLVQLIGSNGILEAERSVSAANGQNITFKNLRPAVYEVQITEDINKNGLWDSGNYYEKRQPEAQIRKKLEELKPNWTLECEIKWQ